MSERDGPKKFEEILANRAEELGISQGELLGKALEQYKIREQNIKRLRNSATGCRGTGIHFSSIEEE